MKIFTRVARLLESWMPETTVEVRAMVEASLKEEQDLVILLFGPPGKGKSNLGHLWSQYVTGITNEFYGINRKFKLERQAAWLGKEYLGLFTETAEKLSHLLASRSMEDLDDLKAKTRGMVYWLDEAKDLNVLDIMTLFNKTFSGILATCRALQHIYILCLDTPTKLIPDIREFRINMGEYVFIGKSLHEFEDGSTRNMRAGGMYGRKEWSRMIFDPSKKIRASLLTPDLFINRYKPYCVESIPLFPRGKEHEEYTMLKYGSMGKIIQTDISRWKLKHGEKTAKDYPLVLMCKNCGHIWEYTGKHKQEPYYRHCCPRCSYKYSLKTMHWHFLGWL